MARSRSAPKRLTPALAVRFGAGFDGVEVSIHDLSEAASSGFDQVDC